MKLFKGEKITIMGLGLHGGGVGVAKFFAKQGARVLVTDLKTKEQLQESINKLRGLKIDYILGRHRQEDFINTDLVIKNPGVPRESYFLKVAKENNIPIKTDIGIFFDLCKAPIIGITGTKGKSTVATLVYELLKTKYKKTILAGNIGISPLEVLGKISKTSKVVLELSSFELEDLTKSPSIAVITNLLPDHLDRYKDLSEYIKAKTPIFNFQKKKDVLISNFDNNLVKKLSLSAPSEVYFYSKEKTPNKEEIKKFGAYLKEGKIFYGKEEEPICRVEDINLLGEHNISNVLAAVSVAGILGIPVKDIKKVVLRFKGVPFRQEFIREFLGVKYFNDTTATMPDAVVEAIKAFSEKYSKSNIFLISGGQNKGLDYKNLISAINKKIKNLILLPGTASDEIKAGLKGTVNVFPVNSMKEAVQKAASLAKEKDIVLLSPGAASFNLFKNEFDRGKQFNEAVKQLNKDAYSQNPSI